MAPDSLDAKAQLLDLLELAHDMEAEEQRELHARSKSAKPPS